MCFYKTSENTHEVGIGMQNVRLPVLSMVQRCRELLPRTRVGAPLCLPCRDAIGHRGATMDRILLTKIHDLSENDP